MSVNFRPNRVTKLDIFSALAVGVASTYYGTRQPIQEEAE